MKKCNYCNQQLQSVNPIFEENVCFDEECVNKAWETERETH